MDHATTINENLRKIQEEGGRGNFVVFEADSGANYYIQFAGQKGDSSLYGEAVGNDFISEGYKLNAEPACPTTRQLGWSAAGANYSQRWEAASDAERETIAQLVVQTLRDVYGIDPTQSLQVRLSLE